jgi:hypothetical protein
MGAGGRDLVRMWHGVLLGPVMAVIVAGCGVTPATLPATASSTPIVPSPSASTVAAANGAWLIADVAEPSAVTGAPSLQPGYKCSPCHAPAAGQLFGVGATAAGLIAVGVEQPPAQAVVFSSTDGRQWNVVPDFTGATGTTAIAVAASGARTVIVGLDASGATAWASDGGSWTAAPAQADLAVPFAAGAMTAVAALRGGFIAGGYRDDPAHATASAAVWRSNDGLTWRADDGAGTFAGGRIWGLAVASGTVVAVGTGGDPNYGPAAAWSWTSATGWRRAHIGPDAGGAMRAVAVTPAGFVAVGLNGHDDGARAWTSRDGLVWTAVPDQPAFHYFSFAVRMQAIVADSAGLVAGGWRSDAGNGSALAWTSADGVTWAGPTWQPSFSGGQITGLRNSGQLIVAVGRTGYPDNNQARVWVRPVP